MPPVEDDPVLAPLVEKYGQLRLDPVDDPFERLVVSIVNQQQSTHAAATIRERLFESVEPTPKGIRSADEETLRAAGLSAKKVEYLHSAAREFEERMLTHERFAEMTDEEIIETMTEIHGVGTWTAKTFLMFGLGREDVFPVEDLGIRRGMERLFGELTRAEMQVKAEAWQPYRSIASLYVWRVADESK
jgi:DNA-3-methyladenine glycosylase II